MHDFSTVNADSYTPTAFLCNAACGMLLQQLLQHGSHSSAAPAAAQAGALQQ